MDLCVFIALSQFFPSMTPDIEPEVISFASKATSVHSLPRQYILSTPFKYVPWLHTTVISLPAFFSFTQTCSIMYNKIVYGKSFEGSLFHISTGGFQ